MFLSVFIVKRVDLKKDKIIITLLLLIFKNKEINNKEVFKLILNNYLT